ncbi:hypothetical protein J4219_08865 [Candidatus Woesearchaeota archaeon]|nr:hypothetical protein [Candidatus Woesearchaeota archaeon]
MGNALFELVCGGGIALAAIATGIYNHPRVAMTSYSVQTEPTESAAFESEEVKNQFAAITDGILEKKYFTHIGYISERRAFIKKIFDAIDDPAYSSKNLITRQEMQNALANRDSIERIVLGR